MSLSNFGFTKSSKGVSTPQEIQTEKEKGDEKELEGDTSAGLQPRPRQATTEQQ